MFIYNIFHCKKTPEHLPMQYKQTLIMQLRIEI